MVDGTKIDGIVWLREMMLKYQDQFVRVVTEKMLTYALGRGLDDADMPAVRAIVHGAEPSQYRFSAILAGIVKSDQFQMNQRVTQTVAAK